MAVGRSKSTISVKMASREFPERGHPSEAREMFWQPLRERDDSYAQSSVSSLEARLCRELGPRLRRRLVDSIQESLRDAEKATYGSEAAGLIEEFRHAWHFRKERDWGYYYASPLERLIEFRQQMFQEIPEMRASASQLLALSRVAFSTSIEKYGSLEIGVTPSSVTKLAEAFAGDFDTLVVLLDAFIPQAFRDVFPNEFADSLEFTVAVPAVMVDEFARARNTAEARQPVKPSLSPPPTVPQASDSRGSDAARRAEWVWRLANGSLLVPVILALLVLYFGLKELSAMRAAQQEAWGPILNHQMQLLKEDRLRMFLPNANVPTAGVSDSGAAGQKPEKTK